MLKSQMPAPKGGKRGKRVKKGDAEENNYTPEMGENQVYAIVDKMLGNRRMTVKCSDGCERMAMIPGKFKGRRSWVDPGMLVLLNIRDFQDAKADVVYIYDPKEYNRLKRLGRLDSLFETDEENPASNMFTFVDETEKDEKDDQSEEYDIDEL